jgi:anionic cell wall polymer biosynthesis LytR-Cps2A-Psr (LCP) family protein
VDPQSLWFAGLVFLCLVILVLLAGTIYRTVHKDAKGAHDLSGASSLLEEIKEETGKQIRVLKKGETP